MGESTSKDGWRTSNKALTDKQKEILPFLADGKSDRYISVELEISVLAVQQRIERVMDIAKCAD